MRAVPGSRVRLSTHALKSPGSRWLRLPILDCKKSKIARLEKSKIQNPKSKIPRVAVVGLSFDGVTELVSPDESLDELVQLSASAGYQVVARFQQRIRQINPAFLIGKGKVESLAEGRVAFGYDTVIFDADLTPNQQRNLEKATRCQVMDRSALILVIFGQRAQTSEGRLQVELAQLEYLLPRLAGQWTHLSRQFGRAGAYGGPGETQIEVDRRQARRRIGDLRREIEKIRRHRSLYRRRRESNGIPQIALVGYTNAGKSTLLNRLTNAGVTSEDRLFSTLDPTTRRWMIGAGLQVLLSDTVGFIQRLPPTLIAAFRATLEELESAELLLQVVDVSHPLAEMHLQTVAETLAELGLTDRPIVTALNKSDRLGDLTQVSEAEQARLDRIVSGAPGGVLVSAVSGQGVAELSRRVESVLSRDWPHVSLIVPAYREDLVHQFARQAAEVKIERNGDETRLEGRIDRRFLPHIRQFAEFVS